MKTVEGQIALAWEISMQRFFHSRTNLFYDYLSRFDSGHELDHLPRPDEIRRNFPNVCGWGTGMEDSAINGGAIISMLCDRYAASCDESVRKQARQVFLGLKSLAEVHGVPGFVARSICPDDQKSVYPSSSRDQYTHFVHGLWVYHHSKLSDETEQSDIRRIFRWISEYAEKHMNKKHDYTLYGLNGKPGMFSKMWEVAPHEAARLPMFYAATWSVTGELRWKKLCHKYLDSALEQSLQLNGQGMLAYSKLQMQCSLDLLYNSGLCNAVQQEKCLAAMKLVANSMELNAVEAQKTASQRDLTISFTDWRLRKLQDVFGVKAPEWGNFLPIHMSIREIGEAALVELMTPNHSLTKKSQEILVSTILGLDFEHCACYGIFYLQAAYWKARRLGIHLGSGY